VHAGHKTTMRYSNKSWIRHYKKWPPGRPRYRRNTNITICKRRIWSCRLDSRSPLTCLREHIGNVSRQKEFLTQLTGLNIKRWTKVSTKAYLSTLRKIVNVTLIGAQTRTADHINERRSVGPCSSVLTYSTSGSWELRNISGITMGGKALNLILFLWSSCANCWGA
jgi:hypothetical protein